MESKKIMVVEDEKLTMLFIVESLKEEGYNDILEYASRDEIMHDLKSGITADLVLMDINIKGATDGIQTAREILNCWNIPIVFMSAYNDKDTIKEILALSLYGFISKPFDERELLIACELAFGNFANNFKTQKVEASSNKIYLFPNCYYDTKTNKVNKDEKPVQLSANELILLKILIQNINNTVSREQLSFELWSKNKESDSALRTIVYLLRKKLKGINISSQSKRGYLLQIDT
jgi:DNA-binding response OmpR family regulator